MDAAFFHLALLSGYHCRQHPPKSLLNQRLGLEAPRCLNASNFMADDISAPSPFGHSFIAGYPGPGGPGLLPTYRRLPLRGHCIDLNSCPLTAPDFVLTPWYSNWQHQQILPSTLDHPYFSLELGLTGRERFRQDYIGDVSLQSRLNAAVSALCLSGCGVVRCLRVGLSGWAMAWVRLRFGRLGDAYSGSDYGWIVGSCA